MRHQNVVHGLDLNRPQPSAHGQRDLVCGHVRPLRHRKKYGDARRGDPQTNVPEGNSWIDRIRRGHRSRHTHNQNHSIPAPLPERPFGPVTKRPSPAPVLRSGGPRRGRRTAWSARVQGRYRPTFLHALEPIDGGSEVRASIDARAGDQHKAPLIPRWTMLGSNQRPPPCRGGPGWSCQVTEGHERPRFAGLSVLCPSHVVSPFNPCFPSYGTHQGRTDRR